MPRVSTELLKEELLRLVTFPVLGIFQLLNFWQNLSTVAYKKMCIEPSKDVHDTSLSVGKKVPKIASTESDSDTQDSDAKDTDRGVER